MACHVVFFRFFFFFIFFFRSPFPAKWCPRFFPLLAAYFLLFERFVESFSFLLLPFPPSRARFTFSIVFSPDFGVSRRD